MLWYNILSPRNWAGVAIKTGNNKIDGIYYNLLSSNQVSLAASGSMFLAANSGIKLISPSFVDASGIRAQTILAEKFGKIDVSGRLIPLYSGNNSGLLYKINDSDIASTNYFSVGSGGNITFPNGSAGSPLYVANNTSKNIQSYSLIRFEDEKIVVDQVMEINNGISLGPNNNLDSYKGYILTHDGSGQVAKWQPNTYLRQNYDQELAFDGLERTGASWIRYPKRPALLKDNKLYIYTQNRWWSPYPAISNGLEQIEEELGTGSDTICVETALGEVVIGYAKLAHVARQPAQLDINQKYVFEENIRPEVEIIDPSPPPPDEDGNVDNEPVDCFELEIAPSNPGDPPIGVLPPTGLVDTNVFIFSVTKGAYFAMQVEPPATGFVTYTNALGDEITTPIRFKPSTANNISIRPNIHTAFNMLSEDIDFLVYGKKYVEYNNYNTIFDLNSNFIPQGLIPTFKVDANIPNSVSGSPTGVIYTTYLDRAKTIPSGWGFDDRGKVCINTDSAYALSSITSGVGLLSHYADLTVSGHTYSTSIVTEDIYLKPVPSSDGTGKYVPNALLTIDYSGKIISRVPKLNPVLPSEPFNVRGAIGHINAGAGHYEYSLQWSAPLDDGRSKIIRYHIQFSLDGGSSWTNTQDTLPDAAAYIDRGLQNQTSCTIKTVSSNVIFRVAAQNGVGVGPYSEASNNFIANINVPTAPVAVSGLREIISNQLSLITLSWGSSAQLGPGGPAAFSGYIIEESEDYGTTWYFHNVPSGNNFIGDNYEIITGSSNDKDYLYRLSAWNNNGSSAYSFVYLSGTRLELLDPEEEEAKNDVLGNWDFGVVLFTGVCNI